MTLIEKIWFKQHWMGIVLWPLLKPASLLFGWLAQRRKNAYLLGRKVSYRAPIPIVVVGNISVGGNGKTPVVVLLIEMLKEMGCKPGVVSRGYGGKAKAYPLLVNGDTDAIECGDEPKLIAQRTGVPVAVDPNRSNAVQALLPQNVDIVVTDDGLQHYALQRDLELVIIDGERRFGNEQLLPLGPLRESVARLADVDFIIANGESCEPSEHSMQLMPNLAVNLVTGERTLVSQLSQCVAIAGIGHPPRFFNTLRQLDCDLVSEHGFSDHSPINEQDLVSLVAQGQTLIMTEKDAVKCAGFAHDNWWYLPVDAQLDPKAMQSLTQHLQQVLNRYGS
jgi:tetraacyldisaccharide 4'-kinase